MSEPNEMPSIEDVVSKVTAEMGPEVDPVPAPEPAPEVAEEPPADVETPPEPAPEPESEKVDYYALAREEMQQAEKDNAFKAREEEFAERERQIAEQVSRLEKIKENPVEHLKHLGITMEDVVNSQLGQQPEPAEPTIEDKLESYKESQQKELEDLKASIDMFKQEKAELEAQKLLAQEAGDIQSILDENSEEFDLVKSYGDFGLQLVSDTRADYLKEYKRDLDLKIACGMVERYLEEHYVKPLLGSSKFKKQFSPEPTPKKPAPRPKEATPTLTAEHSPEASVKNDLDQMSSDEAIAHLAKVYQGKINSKN